MEVDDVDTVEQILAESMFFDHRPKVSIRCTDYADISAARLTVTQHLVGLVLQHPQ